MTLRRYANTVTEALDRADARHWTKQPPRSGRARIKFLRQHTQDDAQALAALLTVPEHEILGLLEDCTPTDTQAAAIEKAVLARWQPRVRRRAHRIITDNDGLMTVSFRAYFGFTAPCGTTDDPRLRFLTTSLRPPYPERLFAARHRFAPEQECHRLLGDALAASYFHHQGAPHSLEAVALQEIDYLEFLY
ncbi:telomere-protecting terminal protein Tpg [Streptomyces anulatus]